MPIVAVCPECGEEHRLKSEHAGRTFRCRQCGEPVDAPDRNRRKRRRRPRDDDFEETRPRRRSRGKSGGGRTAIIITCSIVGGFLLIGGLWFLFSGGLSGSWKPDSSIASRLTEEHPVGSYTVSAPDSLRVVGRSDGTMFGGRRSELRLMGPEGSVWITVQNRRPSDDRSRPEIYILENGDRRSPDSRPDFTFPRGEASDGSISGIPFARAVIPNGFGAQHMCVYVGYDGDVKVEMRCMTRADVDDERFLLIDGVARSLRRN